MIGNKHPEMNAMIKCFCTINHIIIINRMNLVMLNFTTRMTNDLNLVPADWKCVLFKVMSQCDMCGPVSARLKPGSHLSPTVGNVLLMAGDQENLFK